MEDGDDVHEPDEQPADDDARGEQGQGVTYKVIHDTDDDDEVVLVMVMVKVNGD